MELQSVRTKRIGRRAYLHSLRCYHRPGRDPKPAVNHNLLTGQDNQDVQSRQAGPDAQLPLAPYQRREAASLHPLARRPPALPWVRGARQCVEP